MGLDFKDIIFVRNGSLVYLVLALVPLSSLVVMV